MNVCRRETPVLLKVARPKEERDKPDKEEATSIAERRSGHSAEIATIRKFARKVHEALLIQSKQNYEQGGRPRKLESSHFYSELCAATFRRLNRVKNLTSY